MLAFHKAENCNHPNPEIIRLLMNPITYEGWVENKVGGTFGVGGFMVNDNRARTPLNLKLFKSSQHNGQDIWQSIERRFKLFPIL